MRFSTEQTLGHSFIFRSRNPFEIIPLFYCISLINICQLFNCIFLFFPLVDCQFFNFFYKSAIKFSRLSSEFGMFELSIINWLFSDFYDERSFWIFAFGSGQTPGVLAENTIWKIGMGDCQPASVFIHILCDLVCAFQF